MRERHFAGHQNVFFSLFALLTHPPPPPSATVNRFSFLSDSIIEIARNLDGLSSALKGMAVASQIVPRPVRDLGYKMISQNRYRFMGKRYEGCRVGDTDEELTRFIEDPEVYLTE